MKGYKDDKLKDRWDLLPWRATQEVVKVLTQAAQRLEDDNWKKIENLERRCFSAACRHNIADKLGEQLDPDSGHYHLAHEICNKLFILEKRLEADNMNIDIANRDKDPQWKCKTCKHEDKTEKEFPCVACVGYFEEWEKKTTEEKNCANCETVLDYEAVKCRHCEDFGLWTGKL